jgi:hypothetical protein
MSMVIAASDVQMDHQFLGLLQLLDLEDILYAFVRCVWILED